MSEENTTPDLPFSDAVAGSTKGAMKAAGAGSGELWSVPIDAIRVKAGFNVRNPDSKEYKERVRNIADSIKANGFYRDKPLEGFVVKEDGADVIYITGGHRRLEAARLAIAEGAELERLPVVAQPAGTSIEDLTVALVTKNNGDPLNPMEIGEVCKRLVGMGKTEKEIAARLGYGKAYISNLLGLVAAPKPIRDLVSAGKVSATLAIETLKKEGGNAVKVLKESVGVAEASGKEKATKKAVKKVQSDAKPKKDKKLKATGEGETQADPLEEANAKLQQALAALKLVTKSRAAWNVLSTEAQQAVNDAIEAIDGL